MQLFFPIFKSEKIYIKILSALFAVLLLSSARSFSIVTLPHIYISGKATRPCFEAQISIIFSREIFLCILCLLIIHNKLSKSFVEFTFFFFIEQLCNCARNLESHNQRGQVG